MMIDVTTVEGLTYLPDIDEEQGDTPKSVETKREIPRKAIWAFLSTPVMLTPQMDLDDQILAPKAATVIEDQEKAKNIPLSLTAEAPYHEQEPYISVAEAENRTRLELLARQYVAKDLSPEEEARLAIATERVRRLIPRVTVEDFQTLERILEDKERIESADIERRRRLGID